MRKYTATFIFIKEDLDVKKSSQVSPWEKITCIKSWLIYKLIKNLTNYTQTTVKPFKFNLHLGYNHKSNTHIWAPDEMQLHKMQYCLHKLISTEIDDNTYLVCKTEGWNKLQCYDLVWYDLFFSLLSCDSFMNIKHTSFAFRKKHACKHDKCSSLFIWRSVFICYNISLEFRAIQTKNFAASPELLLLLRHGQVFTPSCKHFILSKDYDFAKN